MPSSSCYRNWDKVSRYEQPRAWVRRVAIRLALRYRRREEARSVPVPPESHANAVDERLWLLWALERLSPSQRAAAAVLFYLEDLTVDDVGARDGLRDRDGARSTSTRPGAAWPSCCSRNS